MAAVYPIDVKYCCRTGSMVLWRRISGLFVKTVLVRIGDGGMLNLRDDPEGLSITIEE